jgi:hypothetical protein
MREPTVGGVEIPCLLLRFEIHEWSPMTESQWYWADLDGTPRSTSVAVLRASLSLASLPPFVLVWRTGLNEWLPAYLITELATGLGMEGVEPAELHQAFTEPPPAPVEWYVECYGGTLPASLAGPSAGMSETRDMNIGASFDPHQMKTVLGSEKVLPIGAFRNVDEYLTHLRTLRDKAEG